MNSKIGDRSQIHPVNRSRFELASQNRLMRRQQKPFIFLGLLIALCAAVFLGYAFISVYVLPSEKIALQIEDKIYTRGDLVDFIRFEQRNVEESGGAFLVGNAVFNIINTLTEYEIAYRSATRFNVTVSQEEVNAQFSKLLGFVPSTPEEINDPTYQSSITEAKRQFFNKARISEENWTDFIKKRLFRDKLKEVLAQNIPRIQIHSKVHVISFNSLPALEVINSIQRSIQANVPIQQIALDFSQDPDVKRHKGELDWIPQGVIPVLDTAVFGESQSDAMLPVMQVSSTYIDPESGFYNVYIVSEYDEYRVLSEDHLQVLSDNALSAFVNQERIMYSEGKGVFLIDLNNEVYNWIIKQVEIGSILPTPTPQPSFSGYYYSDGWGHKRQL